MKALNRDINTIRKRQRPWVLANESRSFEDVSKLRARPMHSDGADAVPGGDDLAEREPLLRPLIGSLPGGAERPRLGLERLSARHVARELGARPVVAVSTRAPNRRWSSTLVAGEGPLGVLLRNGIVQSIVDAFHQRAVDLAESRTRLERVDLDNFGALFEIAREL